MKEIKITDEQLMLMLSVLSKELNVIERNLEAKDFERWSEIIALYAALKEINVKEFQLMNIKTFSLPEELKRFIENK